jgi:hypothetical protein
MLSADLLVFPVVLCLALCFVMLPEFVFFGAFSASFRIGMPQAVLIKALACKPLQNEAMPALCTAFFAYRPKTHTQRAFCCK